ncbi:2-dehydro-3-deoxygluconokinase [Novosphingobium sp. CF614]|nr:2-dehydro-3-deoxygluconokinase [Novosphingobium sp. CF614]
MGYGGDTLNTAIHLARAGHDVAYMTALGNDLFSRHLRSAWAAEGLDCSLVMTHPVRHAGLYAIVTDDAGERSFTYWRDTSAARAMFELDAVGAAMAKAERVDLFCFSLISLAILPPQGRDDLLKLAARVRDNGGLVAFDGNFRPQLWETRETAILLRDRAIALADMGLPTFEDEAALSGAENPDAVARHWHQLGCGEVVVKLGPDGCRLPDGTPLPPSARLDPIDTSGAGDAFNGGYLAARAQGASVAEAARSGHDIAAWTVMRRGAVPPLDSTAPYSRCFPDD